MSRQRNATTDARPLLNRERVLQSAVDLADESGLDALTMRELGQRLGVEAMSLYNHVANKDDILDGMLDLVVSEIDLPSGDVDWRVAMRRRAASAREVFARHPWASALNDSHASSGPGRLHYFDWVIGTLRRAGFSVGLAVHAFSAIDSYIYGFGHQQLNSAVGEGTADESAAAFLSQIPAGEFPHLAEVISDFMLKGRYDEEVDFEFGLGLILDGLERARDQRDD